MYVDRYGNPPVTFEDEEIDRWSGTPDAKFITALAVAIINAGYEGVRISETRVGADRYFHYIHANTSSPEGGVFEGVRKLLSQKKQVPPIDELLAIIENETISARGNHDA